MKTRKLLFWLIVPFLAFALASCDKSSSSSSGGGAAVTPSVSVEEVSFDNDASSQIVTINLGKYKFYGAMSMCLKTIKLKSECQSTATPHHAKVLSNAGLLTHNTHRMMKK